MLDAQAARTAPTLFAGTVLVAPFSSLPSLLLTYRIGGILPILLPLRVVPPLARYVTSLMVDKWPTADRLAAYYEATSQSASSRSSLGSLHIIHARNDADISFRQTEMICQRILGRDADCVGGNRRPDVLNGWEEGRVPLRFDIVEHGGESFLYHNVQFVKDVLTCLTQATTGS